MGSSSVTGDESILFTDNMSFDGTKRGGKMTANGELWIGATASPHVRKSTLTAGPGVTITNGAGAITIGLVGGETSVQHLTGNTGGQLDPDASQNFNIVTANSTVKFAGSASTLTQDFGITNVALGSSLPVLTTGTTNVSVGNGALALITGGNANSVYGTLAAPRLTNGSNNVILGSNAGRFLTTSDSNVLVGYFAGSNITTGLGSNVTVGINSLNFLTTGLYNITLGANAGSNYVSTESSNILISNLGTAAESNTTRIGTQGSGDQQQNRCFIAGIVGITNSNQQSVTIDSTTGQLGVTTFAPAYAYTATAVSYQVLITDKIIGVTSNASARTITMPNAGMTAGQSWSIKDEALTAQSANNITISGNGANIDGSSTYVINVNGGSATLYWSGTNFFVY